MPERGVTSDRSRVYPVDTRVGASGPPKMDQPELRAALAEKMVAFWRDRRDRGFAVPIKVGEILDAITETYGTAARP